MTRAPLAILAVFLLVLVAGCADPAPPDDREPPDARALAAYFVSAGLPLEEIVERDGSSDPDELPGEDGAYVQKVSFRDMRLRDRGAGVISGGSIEVFGSTADARQRERYLKTYSAGIDLGLERYVQVDAVLLRLSRHFSADDEEEYRDLVEAFLDNR